MATSTICNQNSVRICSVAVNMNNTDESFFFTVGVLKLQPLVFIRCCKCRLLCTSKFERERTKPLLFYVCCSGRLSSPTEMLPVECVVVN